MDEAEGTILLLDAEPVGSIGGIGGFIYTSGNLLLEYVDDFIEDTGWDGDILVNPRGVRNGWDLDWREIVVSEASAFGFSPCKCFLVKLEDVLG